ncbi:MAG TPA: GspH/FimT family pseudopilin [Thermoanaerobaculia bacterium]|nr:GspH/FimT family pseudopilin [Thermoanaerobaculia bacterium]
MRRTQGFSLIELLIVVAIIGLTAGVATPHAQSLRRRAAVRATVAEIRAMFRAARSRAVTRSANAGVKFTQGARDWQFAIYDDGDGDGVRTDDIKSGIDRRATKSRNVSPDPELASVALPSIVAVDPDGAPMKSGASPVQFGSSKICSFSAMGQATSGTIYLADSGGEAWCVRVFGGSGRVRLLRYDAKRRRWENH